VLEGSVRKASDRVRITGQLIDATTGGHLWAERYEGTLDDIFELQDRIAANVADPADVPRAPVDEDHVEHRLALTRGQAVEAELDGDDHRARRLLKRDDGAKLRRERAGHGRAGHHRRTGEPTRVERVRVHRIGRIELRGALERVGEDPLLVDAARGELGADGIIERAQQCA